MIAKVELSPDQFNITSEKMWMFALNMYTIGNKIAGNGTECAKVAYGADKSDNYLAMTASRLIRNDKIKAVRRAIQGNIVKKFELKAEKVISRLAKIGGIEQSSGDDNILATTSGDQTRALDLLGKHLKLWDRLGESDPVQAPPPFNPGERKFLCDLNLEMNKRTFIESEVLENEV